MWLLGRLIPLVQERVNLIELAPKGTGKSYVYLNLSGYVRLISGGKVTPAVLFHNNASNQPGLLEGLSGIRTLLSRRQISESSHRKRCHPRKDPPQC